jgi:hypothetical protein
MILPKALCVAATMTVLTASVTDGTIDVRPCAAGEACSCEEADLSQSEADGWDHEAIGAYLADSSAADEVPCLCSVEGAAARRPKAVGLRSPSDFPNETACYQAATTAHDAARNAPNLFGPGRNCSTAGLTPLEHVVCEAYQNTFLQDMCACASHFGDVFGIANYCTGMCVQAVAILPRALIKWCIRQ